MAVMKVVTENTSTAANSIGWPVILTFKTDVIVFNGNTIIYLTSHWQYHGAVVVVIYNYLCNQCLSSLKLWVRTPLSWGVLNTTLCDKVCQWLATNQ
jgi:hypothetical protein